MQTFSSKRIDSDYAVVKPVFKCALKTVDTWNIGRASLGKIAEYEVVIVIPISIVIFADGQEDELADFATFISGGDTAGSGMVA